VIPDAAVEAATEVLVAHQRHNASSCLCGWSKLGHSHPAHQARFVLFAATPHLLSHEREETRLAHLDAVVNAASVDRLERELKIERQKVELLLSTQSRPAALPALAKAWGDGYKAGKSDEFAHNKGFTGYHANPYH
jgi:hypothetical protein